MQKAESMFETITLGQRLRRFRRLQGIKQNHLAQMLGVSQGNVSRWESGAHSPDPVAQRRIEDVISARTDSKGDAALKRLIATSSLRIHLVCDATHRLLAVSPNKAASWRVNVDAYVGTSLWRYASQEIIQAEQGLAALGWFERPFQSFRFYTGANSSSSVIITPGLIAWETVLLSDGRVGRLTTAIDSAA
jgi:transcriptional regulator with XRE-family HTH domain